MQCESCSKQEGALYCIGCKKHYCISCDNTAHPLNHSSVSAQKTHFCPEHEQLIDMFCDSCESLLCPECTRGHHASYHHLLSIPAIYRKRCNFLKELLADSVHTKREKVIRRIEDRTSQIQLLESTKNIRETEIGELHNQVTGRLEAKVAPWISNLEKELSAIKADVELYDEALRVVHSEDILLFLREYAHTMQGLSAIAEREMHLETVYNVETIPRELEEVRGLASSYSSLSSLNLAKNEILWRVHSGAFKNNPGVVKREVLQWSRLTDSYLGSLARLRLFCSFCMIPLDPNSVNSPCRMNTRENARRFLSDSKAPSQAVGNSSHYFQRNNE